VAGTTKGWESIGSLGDRKKENVVEAKPWVGETLKAGGKKTSGAAKLAVFRDPVSSRLLSHLPDTNTRVDSYRTNSLAGLFAPFCIAVPRQADIQFAHCHPSLAAPGHCECAREEGEGVC
jgi:hypothetical protein